MYKIKSHKSVEQIAKKHRLDVSFVQKQLNMGIPIEHEHTKDKDLATDIALQHLDEIPDYYTRLKKMESSAKKSHKKYKDVTEENKKGLWDNIHARREKGLPRKKPGQKGYPETLNIKEDLKQARKNVGASKCWTGRVAKGTKIKDGEQVPDCVPIKENAMIRYCPRCEKNETRNECKYGQMYWDMFSLPSKIGKDYDSNRPHPGNFPESYDHEYSMARSELATITSAAKRLQKKLKGEGNIEAWVQSKITKAADYIDTAADYIDSGQGKVNEDKVIKGILKGSDPKTQIKKSSGAGALTPNAAQQLGPKAVELQHKKAAAVSLPKLKKESTSIEDVNGNSFAEVIDIIGPNQMRPIIRDNCLKGFEQFVVESTEAWQKANKNDGVNGLSQSTVDAYKREHPGSKLQTAVTEKNPKGKRKNRRSSYCSRSAGQRDMHNIDCSKTPDKPICKARKRWRCH